MKASFWKPIVLETDVANAFIVDSYQPSKKSDWKSILLEAESVISISVHRLTLEKQY